MTEEQKQRVFDRGTEIAINAIFNPTIAHEAMPEHLRVIATAVISQLIRLTGKEATVDFLALTIGTVVISDATESTTVN